MRALIVAAVAACSLAGLVACSAAPAPVPAPVTVTAPAPSAPAPSVDPVQADPMAGMSNADKREIFLTTVAQQGLEVTDEDGIVDAARTLCDEMDAGLTTFEDFVSDMTAGGSFTAEDAGFVYGAATQVYCPEHVG